MSKGYIHSFGDGRADGDAGLSRLLGGKGANLAEMTNLGIPVPPGFTISTEACIEYMKTGQRPDGLEQQVDEAIALLEQRTGMKFGDPNDPLLVSVRSGAAISMPGMMDTVLNLGLSRDTIAGHVARADDRFAWDCYRRLVQMYSDVVLDRDVEPMERLIDARKDAKGTTEDTDLTAEDWQALVDQFIEISKADGGQGFPDDPREQLWGSIEAVFASWNNDRAISYRRMERIPDDLGTAVNVQAMVFGNMGDDCATGVAFTRDPASGEKVFFGEWLRNAQGEDVVAGTRTPQPLKTAVGGDASLESSMPEAFAKLNEVQARLEKHYQDMQDIEFTIQRGELYLLQTRSGKRTGVAAVRCAVEMVEEGLIDQATGLKRVNADALEQLLKPVFKTEALKSAESAGSRLAHGLNAGPGAATGRVALSADRAVEMSADGPVLLVRIETSPEDIDGMKKAEGILTARGGATSHAALVARQMGKPCVAGCDALDISYDNGTIKVGDITLREGDFVSLDGTTGWVYQGEIGTEPSEVYRVIVDGTLGEDESVIYPYFAKLMSWADEHRRLGVRTNSDTPEQAAAAVKLGAQGIGLTRTEHMFFEEDRILAFRKMIVAEDETARRAALGELLPMQRADFAGIFEAMGERPVTIRLLDPPLHEFLPHEKEPQEALAKQLGFTLEQVQDLVAKLSESNPMLGHRGCRLAISYPEICEMQTRAILEAACDVVGGGGQAVPEIMVPLISEAKELVTLRTLIDATAEKVFEEKGRRVDYLVGTMIEIPRAALMSKLIAETAQFFSFGTNDLTQMAFGLSRDDTAPLLDFYVEGGHLPADPFQTIDQDGVGRLVETSAREGREGNPTLKLGICGEHGGDGESVKFFHRAGLDYVSCSPPRLPTARLAAAQAALEDDATT
ncbi:MAG: pyruvate, phosphate dikinase [Acidobacteriota bacterium]